MTGIVFIDTKVDPEIWAKALDVARQQGHQAENFLVVPREIELQDVLKQRVAAGEPIVTNRPSGLDAKTSAALDKLEYVTFAELRKTGPAIKEPQVVELPATGRLPA